MRNLFALFLTLVIISCSDQSSIESDPKQEHLTTKSEITTFKDWEHFNKVYKSIFHLGPEALQTWIENKGHHALYNIKDTSENQEDDINSLTNGLLAILNQNQEFQIGEDIIYFTDNVFYKVGSKHSKQKSNWKSDLNGLEVIGGTHSKLVSDDSIPDENQRSLVMGTNSIAGSNQKEFDRISYQDCVGGPLQGTTCCKLKHVYELRSRGFDLGYPNVLTELYVDIKLEYRSRNRWRAAGEYRNITYNLTGSAIARYSNGVNADPVYIGPWSGTASGTISCVNQHQHLLLADAQFAQNLPAPAWYINLQGTISQHVNRDANINKWNKYISW